jgi:selenocysteine lyase/cysteine desulfurase
MGLFDTDELNELRALFPHTGKRVYLHHAGVSPLSVRVTDAMKAFLSMRSTGKIDDFHGCLALIAETKALLAKLIGADAEEIVLTKNTSEGINIVANGLGLRDGDRILLNDREFPTNVLPFLNLERGGVGIDFAECAEGMISAEMLEERLTGRTRLISVSHVCFLSGFRTDLEAIGRMTARRGTRLCVDAIQSAGVLPLDVRRWGVDFASAGGHKFLMSPLGTGFLFVRKESMEILRPPYVSWLSVKEPFDFLRYDLDLLDDARRYEYGTPNMVGIAGMKAAISLLLEVGIARIESHVLALLRYLEERLAALGVPVVSDYPPAGRSGIFLYHVPEGERFVEWLEAEGITVSLRGSAVRVAPHFYNSPDEIERLFVSTKRFLERGGMTGGKQHERIPALGALHPDRRGRHEGAGGHAEHER